MVLGSIIIANSQGFTSAFILEFWIHRFSSEKLVIHSLIGLTTTTLPNDSISNPKTLTNFIVGECIKYYAYLVWAKLNELFQIWWTLKYNYGTRLVVLYTCTHNYKILKDYNTV